MAELTYTELAERLEKIWSRHRMEVWKKSDFEFRLENAKINQEMGTAVREVCNVLRQAEKDIIDCEAQVALLRNTVCKIQSE